MTPSTRPTLRLLATGGTIAGVASHAQDHVQYQAAALPVEALVAAVPALSTLPTQLQAEQILAKDSKDLDPEDWLTIARHTDAALQDPDVAGVVITHGTDTLEETAWFLHRTLPPSPKPVVLVSAMRPATALGADGPANLWDACLVALSHLTASTHPTDGTTPANLGVVTVAAGEIHAATAVQKLQPYRIPAFSSGNAGPLARVEEGHIVWPESTPPSPPAELHTNAASETHRLMTRGSYQALLTAPSLPSPPAVAWITSHAGFEARMVQALRHAAFDGLVVAGTGNATLHHALEQALDEAAQTGWPIVVTSRCALGHAVVSSSVPSRRVWPLPAAKARLELLMELWMHKLTQSSALPSTHTIA